MDHRRRRYLEVVIIATIAALIFKVINNVQSVMDGLGAAFSYIVGSLNYFIWGFVIAYFLNPLLKFLEKHRLPRFAALPVIYVFFIGLIFMFAYSIFPVAVSNLSDITANLQSYINNANDLLVWITENTPSEIVEVVNQLQQSVVSTLRDLLNYIAMEPVLAVSRAISYLSNALMLVFFGVVLSIYMLWEKENVSMVLQNIATATLGMDRSKKLVAAARKTHSVFANYVSGKILDSLIIMAIETFGFFILGIPFSYFFGVLNGILNMIPYFGPVIGGVLTVLIVLFIDPIKALWALIFILVVQQLDGWIIGPKIIGNKMGISTLLLLVSVLLGQQFMGIPGMFIGAPIGAAIKLLVYDEYLLPMAQKAKRYAYPDGAPDETGRNADEAGARSGTIDWLRIFFSKIIAFIRKIFGKRIQ